MGKILWLTNEVSVSHITYQASITPKEAKSTSVVSQCRPWVTESLVRALTCGLARGACVLCSAAVSARESCTLAMYSDRCSIGVLIGRELG